MSIPVTASTETFTPACMAEIEGAPTFTFRHATVLDKHRYPNLVIEAGLRHHPKEAVREAIIEQLRAEFDSEGLEQNITKLTAYWAAVDEYQSAMQKHEAIVAEIVSAHEGDDEPELPPKPKLDFPEADAAALDAMVDQVCEESAAVRKMLAQNHWHSVMMPRLLMRMFLTATSLPVKLKKAGPVLTEESVEAVYEALGAFAAEHGVPVDVAVAEVEVQAFMAFRITGDEEKNSSSPRSGSSAPKSSASKQSSGRQTTPARSASSAPATSEAENGSSSSASDSPVSA
jgi:hypothetical protein